VDTVDRGKMRQNYRNRGLMLLPQKNAPPRAIPIAPMLFKIEDLNRSYPDLLDTPAGTRAVATTRDDNGFFPVFRGQFDVGASEQVPDVMIVGQDWGDAVSAENKNSRAENLSDSNFTNLNRWLGFSGLSLRQIFFTNLFLFVHSG
jgi:hypothetical protein